MKKKVGDYTLRELRKICDNHPGCYCEATCPLVSLPSVCQICDNDMKKHFDEELEVNEE